MRSYNSLPLRLALGYTVGAGLVVAGHENLTRQPSFTLLLNELVNEFVVDVADTKVDLMLDADAMNMVGLKPAVIMKQISASTKGVTVKKVDEAIISVTLNKKGEELNALYKLKENLKKMYVSGIKKITQVLPVKKENEHVILTAGTNLKTVLEMPEVDVTRTTSNDIYEIASVFGIEAARQLIIEEVMKVIENQGLKIDIRHVMLAADTMCMTGEIKGITRYGIVGEKVSVLARASFETPIKHIIDAALVGEVDNLNSVVENAMLNQPVPMGTGLPSLITKK